MSTMTASPIIGIDLGTTNSEVAIVVDGRVEVIAENDNKMLPSVVGLGDDGKLLVGIPAKNQLAVYPERTIKSIKRLMGKDERVVLGDQSYRPQEISAIILKQLKSRAEKYLGRAVDRCVITVPAYFSDAQRQATREAGEIAGMSVERIINEPTAAALAYEASEQVNKKILVFDLGGGTFDVSIVSMQGGVVEVLSSHGNNHLGGDDFDEKIVRHILDKMSADDVDPRQDKKAMARIGRAAEAAKITLSDAPFAKIEEEFLSTHKGQPYNLSLELARGDYEEMIAGYIYECMEAVQTALEGAKMPAGDIDEVLLVGGSTRTPLVKKRLAALFPVDPKSEIDPDLCVATGAAMQAAVIAGEKVSSVLVDITPYTFGTSCLGERDGMPYPHHYVPLIDKNTALPVTKSDVFYTVYDGQATVKIDTYQGEDPDALNNIPLGVFTVEGLGNVPANNPIVISFSLDLNGILKVTAIEKNTGLQKSIVIDNAMREFDDDAIAEARVRIGALFDVDETGDDASPAATGTVAPAGKNAAEENPLHRKAKALIEQAKKIMDDADEEDREDMVDCIESITEAMKTGDQGKLNEAAAELEEIVYYLET